MDHSDFSIFMYAFLVVIFQVFWSKSKVLGRIGRSGKVLGFISSNFGPNPTAGRLLKGNKRGAILIIIIPAAKSGPKTAKSGSRPPAEITREAQNSPQLSQELLETTPKGP